MDLGPQKKFKNQRVRFTTICFGLLTGTNSRDRSMFFVTEQTRFAIFRIFKVQEKPRKNWSSGIRLPYTVRLVHNFHKWMSGQC